MTARAESAELTISSKRQITLPAAMARKLGIEPGHKIVAVLGNGAIVLKPRPQDWLEYITSGPHGVYGRTKEEVDAYVREVREGWDERARMAEGAAYIPEDAEDYAERIERMRKGPQRVADGQ
jgi:AbrB family looped-hinge helix DNA binding protein